MPEIRAVTAAKALRDESQLIHDLGNTLNAIHLQLWLAASGLPSSSAQRSRVETAARELRVATHQLAALGEQIQNARRSQSHLGPDEDGRRRKETLKQGR